MANNGRPASALGGGTDITVFGIEELLGAVDRAAQCGNQTAAEWIVQMIYDTLDKAVPQRNSRPRRARAQPMASAVARRRWN